MFCRLPTGGVLLHLHLVDRRLLFLENTALQVERGLPVDGVMEDSHFE